MSLWWKYIIGCSQEKIKHDGSSLKIYQKKVLSKKVDIGLKYPL
jgi:hypothetical protein